MKLISLFKSQTLGILIYCGFFKIEGTGSAVKFYDKKKDVLINLHKPHPSNILKVYIIKQIREKIEEVCNG
ncbi:MAG: type II toxin-antitoxin system HicA family toxin [Epsilonproteobacteria bacterium]|nr:type II toxin-antitoxin system HicA family toxin [Campylobacterota bacterium]